MYLQVEREGKIQEEIKKVESERGWFSFWRSKNDNDIEKEKDISNFMILIKVKTYINLFLYFS